MDISLAYESERGVQAICPTTGDTYITSQARYSSHNGRRVVSCRCRHCDALLHTRQDREFNPSEPQWHTYFVADHAAPET
jgi:hypothetical protein